MKATQPASSESSPTLGDEACARAVQPAERAGSPWVAPLIARRNALRTAPRGSPRLLVHEGLLQRDDRRVVVAEQLGGGGEVVEVRRAGGCRVRPRTTRSYAAAQSPRAYVGAVDVADHGHTRHLRSPSVRLIRPPRVARGLPRAANGSRPGRRRTPRPGRRRRSTIELNEYWKLSPQKNRPGASATTPRISFGQPSSPRIGRWIQSKTWRNPVAQTTFATSRGVPSTTGRPSRDLLDPEVTRSTPRSTRSRRLTRSIGPPWNRSSRPSPCGRSGVRRVRTCFHAKTSRTGKTTAGRARLQPRRDLPAVAAGQDRHRVLAPPRRRCRCRSGWRRRRARLRR